jgi:hypothetical protein
MSINITSRSYGYFFFFYIQISGTFKKGFPNNLKLPNSIENSIKVLGINKKKFNRLTL